MRTLTGLTLSLIMISGVASAATYVVADDSYESRICVSAATDGFGTFKAWSVRSGIGLKLIANKLSCNDVAVADFAADAGNQRVSDKLHRLENIKSYLEINVRETSAMILKPSANENTVIYVKGR